MPGRSCACTPTSESRRGRPRLADQLVQQLRRRSRRITQRRTDAPLALVGMARIPGLHPGRHHAGRVAMGNAMPRAQHVADRMARAHRHARGARDLRLPGAHLTQQPRLQVGRIPVHAAQPFAEQPQGAFGHAVAVRVGFGRCKRLGRMVHGADSRGQPQPLGRVQRRARVQHDRHRRHVRMHDAVLLARALVGDAGQSAEFAAGQGRGHAHERQVRSVEGGTQPTVLAPGDQREAVEVLRRNDPVAQPQVDDLRGVDHRTAAYRDDHVGAAGTSMRDAGHHVRARDVRRYAGPGRGMRVAERLLDLTHDLRALHQ